MVQIMSDNKLLNDIVAYLSDQILEELLETNWTRGHWHANHSGHRIIIESTTTGDIIAVIGQSTAGRVKAQANAQLIVMAPRLYQALDNLVVSAYDTDDGDCLICGAQCAWGAGPHEGECEVAAAAKVLAEARGEKR
jgi:hypothetical protein